MIIGNIPFEMSVEFLIVLLSISLVLCFLRLYVGPNTPNRVVAFDLITIHAVAIIALFAMRVEEPVLLDAAIIVTVLGFLGTVMLSYFLERSQQESPETELKSDGEKQRSPIP